MAITHIRTETATFSASRSPAITFAGAEILDGDILLVGFVAALQTATITTPSGYVNVLGANTLVASDSHVGGMVYHVPTSSEAGQTAWTITNLFDVTQTGRAVWSIWRGVDLTTPLAGTSSTFDSANAATPFILPSVTPTADNVQVVGVLGSDGSSTQSAPAGWTQRAGAGTTQGCYIYSRDALGSNGVATGATNVTPSAGDEYASVVCALRPAAPPVSFGFQQSMSARRRSFLW